MVLPWLGLLAVPYIIFVDGYMKQPEDGYYWLGRCLLLEGCRGQERVIGQHLLGWVVKGFFLPLMFIYLTGNVNKLMGMNLAESAGSFIAFFHLAVLLIFTLDLLTAAAGYGLTFRLFDTHIRSSDPTFLGWWVCLSCYMPFAGRYLSLYLSYGGSENDWIKWLHDYPGLQMLWGGAMLAALVVYVGASINFGCRFSNLTHRGILTRGMYGFTKHPAYVSKNLYWWMAFVPFASHGAWQESLRFCALLLGTNLVYYLRARTEERHLSHDPDYVAYALAMNERSVFGRLARRIPFLRYTPPPGWETVSRPYQGIR